METFLNWTSVVTILGAMAGIIPPLAALLAASFYLIQIYESKTMKDWRTTRRLAKAAKLEAKAAALRKLHDVPSDP